MSEAPKFKTFLTSKKIDPRRVLLTSYRLERLTRDDRAIKRAKGTKVEGADAATKETRKPHSGRPVTPRSLDAALTGKPLSGPTKQRILRAVNALLEQKKQEKVELKTLF
jgi:hypothetical protein